MCYVYASKITMKTVSICVFIYEVIPAKKNNQAKIFSESLWVISVAVVVCVRKTYMSAFKIYLMLGTNSQIIYKVLML